jgi:DHA1 family bicyclomycin/chloramphenicol resistance-like MFS transporter
MMVLVWRLLPESLPREQRHAFHGLAIAKNYLMVLRRPKFLLLALAVGLAFGGLSLYIGSAANFVMEILHLPETAFAWMFIPMIGGFTIGSAWGGKQAGKMAPARMIWLGFAIMIVASLAGVAYNLLFVAAVPWAVLPLAFYTFGLAVAMPALQLGAFGLFPDNRGLVAPLLFGSALKLAIGVTVGLVLSFICWRLALQMEKTA